MKNINKNHGIKFKSYVASNIELSSMCFNSMYFEYFSGI